MDKNHINLCLSGQSFRIVTDDDVDYVKQLEKRINSRIESYKKRYPQMSATRCTLLAMLELEDELARAKENYEALDAKILLIFMQKYRISLNNCRFSPIFL